MAPRMSAGLARAKAYLAIAESKDSKREAYKLAAREIAAAVEEGMSQRTVATVLGKSPAFVKAILDWQKSAFKAETPWLADEGATTRAARSHAKKLLADESEATKLIAGLSDSEKQTLAKVVADNPTMSRNVGDAIMHKSRNPAGAGAIEEPKFPLLHRVEGDRQKLKAAAELMAGHWHDGRHDIGEEEERLVRDSMAQAVVVVEKTITDALKSGVGTEVL